MLLEYWMVSLWGRNMASRKSRGSVGGTGPFKLVADLRNHANVIAAIARVKNTTEIYKERIPKVRADLYKRLLLNALNTQMFAGSYAPLSQAYVEEKAKTGRPTGFWKYNLHLYQAIAQMRGKRTQRFRGTSYIMGITRNQSVMNQRGGTSKDLTTYVAVNEAMRPLFGRVFEILVNDLNTAVRSRTGYEGNYMREVLLMWRRSVK